MASTPTAVNASKLFVGGLGPDATEGDLDDAFAPYGRILATIVMRDPTTNRSRGFGFVTFAEPASAASVLAEGPYRTIGDRTVEVKPAVPKDATGPATATQAACPPTVARSAPPAVSLAAAAAAPSSGDTSVSAAVRASAAAAPGSDAAADSTPRMAGEPANIATAVDPHSAANGRAPANPADSVAGRKLFAGGLHYNTDSDDLLNYCLRFGPVESAQVMYNRETMKSRGFGFVTFASVSSANKALENRMHTINDKQVELKLAIPAAKTAPKSKARSSRSRSSRSSKPRNRSRRSRDTRAPPPPQPAPWYMPPGHILVPAMQPPPAMYPPQFMPAWAVQQMQMRHLQLQMEQVRLHQAHMNLAQFEQGMHQQFLHHPPVMTPPGVEPGARGPGKTTPPRQVHEAQGAAATGVAGAAAAVIGGGCQTPSPIGPPVLDTGMPTPPVHRQGHMMATGHMVPGHGEHVPVGGSPPSGPPFRFAPPMGTWFEPWHTAPWATAMASPFPPATPSPEKEDEERHVGAQRPDESDRHSAGTLEDVSSGSGTESDHGAAGK